MSKLHFVILAAACGLAQAQGLSTEAWQAVTDARGVQRIHVNCGPEFFDPREIIVRSNVPVELLVRTSAEEQVFISGFSADQAIGRQPTVHSFTPVATGHFPLLCQRKGATQDPGARARNKGVLTVVPVSR